MFFDIQPDAAVPIYEQIMNQVIFAVASGAAAPGTTIPSIRELNKQLVVNPNTIARAFRELEQRGVVAAKRGVGMEVTAEAPKVCKAARQEVVRGRIRAALREAVASGLGADELRRLVDEELTHANGQARTGKRG